MVPMVVKDSLTVATTMISCPVVVGEQVVPMHGAVTEALEDVVAMPLVKADVQGAVMAELAARQT